MKKRLYDILLALVLIAGVSLLLYPTVADWWNSRHQTRAVVSYNSSVSQMDEVSYQAYWEEARAYNESLLQKPSRYYMSEEEKAVYNAALNVTGNGVMGRIEIPKIDVSLPVYHTTDEGVLQTGIGHIEGTSLPTGGVGTHCALSGHRGLPSAKLFTNLDRVEVGDRFTLHVLDEALVYEVDQILVVEPSDMSALEIDPALDLCTLVTCTPYGINSHRLLVRGARVEDSAPPVNLTSDAALVNPLVVAAFMAAPILLVWMMFLIFAPKKR